MPSRRRKTGSAAKKKTAKKKGGNWLGRVLAFGALAAVLAVAGGAFWLWPRCDGAGCPDVGALRNYTPPQASRVFDGDGELITHLAPERRIVVPLARIPSHVTGAFLAVEDQRFFNHSGVDYRRVAGAAVRDLRSMSFDEGFSTITMQLARNVFPEHLTRAKTLRRKAWEVLLAREMEREFTKKEILQMYLNQIYLGDGFYGVEAAAQGYFGKSAAELGVAEAAMLAALPKAPSNYNPRDNPAAATARRNLVLTLMANAEVISQAEAREAIEQPIVLAPPFEAGGDAPYFVAAIRRELKERFGEGGATAGFRIYTGLDRAMQKSAVEALRSQLDAIESGDWGRFRGPDCGGDEGATSGCLQAAFVALDNETGDVVAMVGGRDFSRSQFDRVTQAHRQAGSSFKPFLYATAVAQGIPISTPLLGPGAADYEGDYRPSDHVATDQPVNLREALKLSSNQAAVVLGERVGVDAVIRTARSLGLTTPMEEYPSTLLGASDVIPIEMASAFTAFANLGTRVSPRLIRRIEDSNGNVIWEAPVEKRAVIAPEVAFITTDMMRDVVDGGTGWRVRDSGLAYDIPAAGKTGTTNEAADAWFVGFTPDVTAATWVGFDERQRITVGGGGGTLAAPIWGKAVASYYTHHDRPQAWQPPAAVVAVQVDVETGQLATSSCPEENLVDEWFVEGTEPREYCRLHPEPGIQEGLLRGLQGIRDRLGI